MFVMDLSPRYYAPVRIPIQDANGQLSEVTFDAHFERLTNAEITAYMEDKQLTTEDAVRKVMKGWKLVKTKDGLDAPFNEENFAWLLNIPGAAKAIWDALLLSAYRPQGAFSAQGQGVEAAEKN